MDPKQRPFYRPDIDGLRALAVLMVVAFHAAPGKVPGGFVGVDVFFVLSGYLITGIILREIREGRFSLLQFYARRCRRIAPALVVVLLGVWMLGRIALFPAEFANLGKHLVAGAGFSANILLWTETGYFDTSAEFKPLLHLWSLGVEEQYYVFWPLVVAISYRFRVLLLSSVALFVGSFAYCVVLSGADQSAAFFLLPTRFWELLAGALLAIASEKMTPPSWCTTAWVCDGAVVVGTSALLAASFYFGPSVVFPGGWALVPVGATALLVLAGRHSRVARVLYTNRPAVLVGLISYPLYLWHWPLLAVSRYYTFDSQAGTVRVVTATLVLLSFLFAWLTWRGIELPLQRRLTPLPRPTARKTVLYTLVILSAVAGLGGATAWSKGFPNRYSREEVQKLEDADLGREKWTTTRKSLSDCGDAFNSVVSPAWCYVGADEAPTVSLYGDSYADQFNPGLQTEYATRNENLLLIGQAGCAPIQEVRILASKRSAGCEVFNATALNLLSATRSIHTVILAFRGPLYISGTGFGPSDKWDVELVDTKSADSAEQSFLQGLLRTAGGLTSAGKSVVVMLPTPELGFHPAYCLQRPLGQKRVGDCAIKRDVVNRRQAATRRVVAKLVTAYPTVRVFDPLDVLCDESQCFAERDGRLLFRDDDHLSMAGSELVARHFANWALR